jgi:tRNA G18 (ribose-2'-O)-methylase SpoU/glycosyltransferase involved in cell wall biosynthesis
MTTRLELIVMDFASHRTWAEGYADYLRTQQQQQQSCHTIQLHITYVPSDRWKWRLQTGAMAELDALLQQWEEDVAVAGTLEGDTHRRHPPYQPSDHPDQHRHSSPVIPDAIIVDGMLDVTLLAARLGQIFGSGGIATASTHYPSTGGRCPSSSVSTTATAATISATTQPHFCIPRRPRLFVYLHENQLTTPFAPGDRDVRQNTHWHYGVAHWRSFQVADGLLFNSRAHWSAFAKALPALIQQQCPRDSTDDEVGGESSTLAWHLARAQTLLRHKCTVLPYGLALDELAALGTIDGDDDADKDDIGIKADAVDPISRPTDTDHPVDASLTANPEAPIILWNARLEPDKDPATFFDRILPQLQRNHPDVPFRLLVLGTDPSRGQQWYAKLRARYADQLVYVGWCTDRATYAHWLAQADVVVSTAQHETFGISLVESVYVGGALPLLPRRLSYPEILLCESRSDNQGIQRDQPNHNEHENNAWLEQHCFYQSADECVVRLAALLRLRRDNPLTFQRFATQAKITVGRFRWAAMGPVYDKFWLTVATSTDADYLVEAGIDVQAAMATASMEPPAPLPSDDNTTTAQQWGTPIAANARTTIIADENDQRVVLYRPKSLRNHVEYHRQLRMLQNGKPDQVDPVLHGGRRAMVRMLEAIATTGARIRVHSFLTTPELADNLLADRVVAAGLDAPVYVAEKFLLDKIRGQKLNAGDAILAMVTYPLISPLSDLLDNPPILILDNVRNAENVGSILRTAFCLGIRSVVASATAWAALKDSRSARCSMGTMYFHKLYRASDGNDLSLSKCIAQVRARGIRVYGIETGVSARPIQPHGVDRNWAAVLGNEDVGLTADVRHACDSLVFIPQAHGDSLNVGHAAAISLFELGREGPMPQHDGKAACR